MDNDLVSIIMPSYNCERYLEAAIRSVQAQTYKHWEIVFVDDCSTDNTWEVVSRLQKEDSRIKLIQNEVNKGAAVSRNNATRVARGKWIAFLDSDDIWEPDKLEKQTKFMIDNKYSFSYTRYAEMDDNGNDTGIYVTGPGRITKAGMYAFCWPGCLTVMYDALAVGVIQIEDIKKNNDYAMWLKVCQKADCYLLDECLAKYRRGRVGSVSSHSVFTMMKWHFKLFREAEKMNVISSILHTCINLVCGLYKKVVFIQKR